MSAPVVQIDKLDDNNYDSWSIQMRSVLIHSGFWKIVSGIFKKPTEAAASSKWESDDEKALASIFLSVRPTQLGYIRSCTTSHQAWKKLEGTYMPRGPIQKVSLYKRLVNLRMCENGNIVQHLNEFSEVCEKLEEVGIKIQEELLVIMLMSSLPKEFENFVVAIETRDDLPSLSTLKQKLLEEGKRRQEKLEGEMQSQQAYIAKSNTSKSNRKAFEKNNKNHFKGKCFICGVIGHYANKCEKRRGNENSQAMSMLAAIDTLTYDSSKWYIDSGATSHMCNNRAMFRNYKEHNEMIFLAGNKHIDAVGKGDVHLKYKNFSIELENVLFSPMLHANFISVSKAVERGLTVKFDKNHATVRRQDGYIVLQAVRRNNMFEFRGTYKKTGLYAIHNSSTIIWHNRYGHLNFNSLQDLSSKSMVNGLNLNFEPGANCETCMLSKIHVLPFPQESQTKSKELLELVHCDVCGPFRETSVGGSKYFVTFIDDKSRRIFVYFLAFKSDVFEKFKIFKAMVECQTSRKIKAIRTDNGKEFVNKEFNAFLEKEGISRQLTVPYTPQQNGVAERANRTLVEMARSMMVHANAKKSLWAEAVNTAVYIRNRCPTRQLQNKTPYELWTGRKPSVKHFRIFGSCAIALDKSSGKSKFDAKGRKYIMVGYSTTSKAYRLYDANKNKVFEQRDVLFDETCSNSQDDGNCKDEKDDFWTFIFDSQKESAEVQEESSDHEGDEECYNTADEDEEVINEPYNDEAPTSCHVTRGPGRPKIIRTGRPGRPKKQYNLLNNAIDENVPKSVKEALSSNASKEWMKAMNVEFVALQKNKTWSLVDLPPGKKSIQCKWVYSIKRNVNGNIERYKARLVAKGCSQRYGIDFYETFSPVVRFSTIRILLALAVTKKMFLHHVDVCTAYLNSNLQDEIYMQQPPNFEDKRYSNKVLRLHKAIYGLKQSGKEWNAKLDSSLRSMNFIPCENEPCLYKGTRKGNLVLIAVYVDDLIIGCTEESIIKDIKKSIANMFDITDKGRIRNFLGIEIEREGEVGPIKICQRQYIRDVLKQYGMESCKSVAVPLEAGYQTNCNNDCEKVDKQQYQSLVGTLMYLAITTRPDILHSISKMAQRNQDPHQEHMIKLKHILRYLAGTIDLKMIYKQNDNTLEGYVDADWGGNTFDRKSFTGFIFRFSGCPITWECKKQASVALSSTEAEYMAVSDAAKEALYLKRLLKEIDAIKEDFVIIYIDNQGAQKLAENPVYHKRSKHIDIRFHHIRDLVQKKEVKLKYCPTDKMIADVMTKNLPRVKHQGFVESMNLILNNK